MYRKILTIFSGNGFSILAGLLCSPLISRLYSPEDFALYATYSSYLIIISLINTGRFDLAIYRYSKRYANLFMPLVWYISIAVSGLYFILFHIILDDMTLNLAIIGSGFLAGMIKMYADMNLRNEQIKTYSLFVSIQMILIVGLQVVFGYLGLKNKGLIYGHSISLLIVLIMYRFIDKNTYTIGIKSLWKLFNKEIDYPKYYLPAELIVSINSQMPIFFFEKFFSLSVLGNYGWAIKYTTYPFSVISAAIGKVYLSEASKVYRKDKNCSTIFISTLTKLLILGIMPFVSLFFFGEEIFLFFFGEKWKEAGKYAEILSVLLYVRLVVSPLMSTLYIADKKKYILVWQIVNFILTLASLLIGYLLFADVESILVLFVGITTISYTIILYYSYKSSLYLSGCSN